MTGKDEDEDKDKYKYPKHPATQSHLFYFHSITSILPAITMKVFQITSLVALMASVTSATVSIGSSCSGSGYDCTKDFNAIASCNGNRWVLSAQCGDGCCVWPSGDPTPWCRC
ncbi:hypothetical protein F5B20DRAFT_586398 [Whalleya microplaca]|nr:hypothetical protein F5B20DRAFT_586398 [Whalleya microplaca]